MFYCNFVHSYPSTTVETPTVKANKVLRTSAKLNNNDNNNDNASKKNSLSTGKRSTRTNNKIVKKQKLNTESDITDHTNETAKFGNSDSENEQLPREAWLVSPTKPNKDTKVGVVLRSSGKIPKNWKCSNPKDISTPPKITTLSKIKTPLTEPMTRILRSHKKKGSRRFKSVASRSSWSAGMVTRSHRRSVKC